MTRQQFPTDRSALITVGLPYANGPLHIGHLRGLIAGDVMARSLRLLGQNTAFVSGSDMHGTPVAVNAKEKDVTPEEFALRWHEEYEEMIPKFNVDFDNYSHTDDETNTELTEEFVRSWIDDDHVYEKTIQVAYDPKGNQYIPDRFVEGTCPYCGERSRGDECDEGCQRHLEPGEIEDAVSTITGNPAEYREREHKFLRLSDFQEYLQGFIDRLEGTANARNQPREWIEGELQDLCITRDMDWGIDYPGEESEDLVLYVWVDAPIEYVASTKQYTKRVGAGEFDWETVWTIDGEQRHGVEWDDEWTERSDEIVHLIGRDIIQHHSVFWPAMLRGTGFNEPRAIVATGFVGIDGKSLSTSRNRAVWADEFLENELPPALIRFYSVTISGIESDIDFTWDRFQEQVNSKLVGTLGNFCYRALILAHRNYEGTPHTTTSDEVRSQIREATEEFKAALNDYRLRDVGTLPVELASFGNEYIQRHEPWNLVDDDPEAAAQVIRDCVQLTKAIAVFMRPVMPDKSADLWSQLDEADEPEDIQVEEALEPPATTFGEPSELFDSLDDKLIKDLQDRLQERIVQTA